MELMLWAPMNKWMGEQLTSYSRIGFNINLLLFGIPSSLVWRTILALCWLIWLIGGGGKTHRGLLRVGQTIGNHCIRLCIPDHHGSETQYLGSFIIVDSMDATHAELQKMEFIVESIDQIK